MFEKVKRLFTPAASMDAEQARAFMNERKEGTYTLLDVRQPGEYEKEHIPGATLVPLAGLPQSYDKLDRDKPVIVYCAIGGRSRVAAQMLSGEGFKEVYNLSGGIAAWEGGAAEGPVGLNLEMVRGDETPVEIIKLAYGMEKSLGGFYRILQERTQDKELSDLLALLASIEDKHKQYLFQMYSTIEPAGMSETEFDANVSATVLEGGFDSDEFIRKNESFLQSVPSILDVAMMLEAQALDLYLRFAKKTENAETRDLLYRIGDEEKSHIQSLARLREERT